MRSAVSRSQSSQRPYGGAISMEIAVSAILMIIFAALGVDITLIALGADLSDSACRDAARAAAQQSVLSSSLQAAQAQMQVHSTDGYWVSQPVLRSASAPDFVYNDFGGSPPANTSPYVTVTTIVTVRCPAPIFFFGAHFMQNGAIQLARSYTYPIIKQKFYS